MSSLAYVSFHPAVYVKQCVRITHLIPLPMEFEPGEHIDVKTHRNLLSRQWPGLGRLLKKPGISRCNIRIVDVLILQPVKSGQVAIHMPNCKWRWPNLDLDVVAPAD